MKNIKDLIELYDKDDMCDAIMSLPEQIEISKEIIKKYSFNNNKKYKNIVVCGMGGSAIGGDFCKLFLKDELSLSIHVNRGYSIPNWVDNDSLVIISSYSGNTEETISCYNMCIDKKIDPVVISTGGYLLKAAQENNNSYIKVPAGYQPRAALGFSLSFIMLTLRELDIINNNQFIDNTSELVESLKDFTSSLHSESNNALDLAQQIYNKYVIIYTSDKLDSVAYRFRCQLAENSKIISSHFIFPEQNHNEIEAFENMNIDNIAFVWLNHPNDLLQNKKRINITKNLLANSGKHYDVKIENSLNNYDLVLKMANFVDWVSFYCALLHKTNPSPVNSISKLKSLL